MEKIIEFILTNLKNRKLHVVLVLASIIFLVILPYLDANIFYFGRMEKRISILNKITQVDTDALAKNKILEEEYVSILNDIKKQPEKSINNIIISNGGNRTGKFISGGLLAWLISLWIPFVKTFKGKGDKFLGFILCVVFGVLLGLISSIIPTIINPWINYVGFNLLLLIILIIAAISKKTEKPTV